MDRQQYSFELIYQINVMFLISCKEVYCLEDIVDPMNEEG
jgi:hypothetical protein